MAQQFSHPVIDLYWFIWIKTKISYHLEVLFRTVYQYLVKKTVNRFCGIYTLIIFMTMIEPKNHFLIIIIVYYPAFSHYWSAGITGYILNTFFNIVLNLFIFDFWSIDIEPFLVFSVEPAFKAWNSLSLPMCLSR